MRRTSLLAPVLAAALALALAAGAIADGEGTPELPPPPPPPTFDGAVKGVLARYACTDCHNPEKMKKSKYDLTTYAAALKNVAAGDPQKSKLVVMVESGKMPPKKSSKRVTAEDLAVLKAWIAAGAPER